MNARDLVTMNSSLDQRCRAALGALKHMNGHGGFKMMDSLSEWHTNEVPVLA